MTNTPDTLREIDLVQQSPQKDGVGHALGTVTECSAREAYLRGLADADKMVGALWTDLFNKDQVKASGADFFDKWRERIRALTPDGDAA